MWGVTAYAGRWFCYHAQALPTYHSQILRKKHSGFANVGSDGLRRYIGKKGLGFVCKHTPEPFFTYDRCMVTFYFKLLLLSYLLPPQ